MDNQEQKMIGALLRLERTKQGKGQKEVCYGICVPSYLSKIEHGSVVADDKILEELFERLGIFYICDEVFYKVYQPKIDKFFEELCYGLKTDRTYEELKEAEKQLLYSKFVADWLLIEGYQKNQLPDLLGVLEENMTEIQKAYYKVLQAKINPNKKENLPKAKEAFDVLGNSFSLTILGHCYYEQGHYAKIHKMENQFTALALEEGNICTLAHYYFLKGTVYASVDMEEMMMNYYERVIRMMQNTNWADEITDVYYNTGATCLSLHKYDRALEYLEKVPDFTMAWHKRALAAIRSGDIEKGKEFLKEMYSSILKEETVNEIDRLRYEEALWECEDNFLENPEYLELLERLIEKLQKERYFGSIYFYKEIVVEAYKKQRKYKKALEFEQEISSRLTEK